MTIEEIKISEIKNLNLIYIFTTDNIFNGKSNKYIGAKVAYENNQVMELSYNDVNFEKFIRHILNRYRVEKDKRKIILLGDLTKELINTQEFEILKKSKDQNFQNVSLPNFNCDNFLIKIYEEQLKETVKIILNVFNHYEGIIINSITGYNYKYVINYSIGNYKKTLPIILNSINDDELNFKICDIAEKPIKIDGNITKKRNSIEVLWECNANNTYGTLKYDSQNQTSEKYVISNQTVIYASDTVDTLLETDENLIEFYLNLVNLNIPNKKLKINDNSFLLSDEKKLIDSPEDVMYLNTICLLNINELEVNIKYQIKNYLNKYNNQVDITLDNEEFNISIKTITIANNNYILIEKKLHDKTGDYYFYQVCKLMKQVKLTECYETSEIFTLDEKVKNMDDVKKYIMKHERSIK